MGGEEWQKTMEKIARQNGERVRIDAERLKDVTDTWLRETEAAVREQEARDRIKRSGPAPQYGDYAPAQQRTQIAPDPPPLPGWSRLVWMGGVLLQSAVAVAILQEQMPGWEITVQPRGRRNGSNGHG